MLFSMLANLAEDRQGVARRAGDDVADGACSGWQREGIGRDAGARRCWIAR